MTKTTMKNNLIGKCVWLSIGVSCLLSTNLLAQGQSPAKRYEQMQRGLSSGWNTWDTRSVLTHVLLPYGAAIDLNLTNAAGQRVNNFRIGDRNPEAPVMHPGPHTYDGFYTDISLDWKGQKLRIQSASEGWNNLILITPLADNEANGTIIITPKALWYRENKIEIKDNTFTLKPFGEDWQIDARVNGNILETNKQGITVSTAQPIVIACGMNVDLAAAQAFIQSHYDAFVKKNKERFGKDYEVYNAMQNVLGWDNIYDPSLHKVITPVSRIWNMNNSMNPSLGGYSMYCWDTYFASMMLATGNKELAYANAVEMTNSITEKGFVPNFSSDNDYKSRDRSQPPVGSMAFWNIYQKYKEKWVLEYVYDKLLSWNRWWDKNRSVDGLLCWGSTPFDKVTYRYWETEGVNDTFGGALESGLDNSHMYDDILFDKEKHVQKLNDVGLSSLYVMDCDLLAKIAGELGKSSDAKELRERGESYRMNLNKLWDSKQGFYYNRHTDTGALNPRISPTNFYPLLANAPTQAQAERMIKEHLFNPNEFWGEWVIPSTPRNDPAFNDNNYWRGRIWAPLNFLVYMGLCNYDLPEARKALSEKSKNLLLKGWLSNGYVFENYNSVTGDGDDVRNSDKFYHWGALLGFITLMEDGFFKEENPADNAAANNAEQNEDWKIEANARIEKYRKEDINIRVVQNGKPVKGATVKVDMTDNEFRFGSNIFIWSEEDSPAMNAYKSQFADVFNFATLAFYWGGYEAERGKPGYAHSKKVADWCKANGIHGKGHPLIWNTGEPKWVKNLSDEELYEAQIGRVYDCADYFKETIDTWDVVNEMVGWDRENYWTYAPRLTSLVVNNKGKVPFSKAGFEAARKGNPNATLLINDWMVDDRYENLLNNLTDENGKPVFDAVGIQSHMHYSGAWNNDTIMYLCDKFAKYGKPIHFTEVTILSSLEKRSWGSLKPGEAVPTDPEGEEYQRANVERFYTMIFSHPATAAITWWDFSDRGAWRYAPAGFLRSDMSPKPAYTALKKLIKEDWATHATIKTNKSGVAKVRAFRGKYTFTVTLPNGKTVVKTFSDTIAKDKTTFELNIGN